MMAGMALIAVADLGTALAKGLPSLMLARLGLVSFRLKLLFRGVPLSLSRENPENNNNFCLDSYQGAGRCISEAGERGLLADLANQIPEMRGRALATQQAVTAVGIAIGAPLGGWVVERYGPRAAFLCVTAAALVALGLYAFLPETVPPQGQSKSTEKLRLALGDGPSSTAPDWADFVAQNKWRGLALCQSGATFGFACKIASIPVLAADILPGGAVGAGALVSAAGLSGLIGAPIGGWLTDQAGAKTTLTLSGLFAAVSLLLVPPSLSIESLPFSVTIPDNQVLEGPALAFSVVVLGWSIGAAAQGPGKSHMGCVLKYFSANVLMACL